jgi:uncharacterized protein involved in response to NO
MAIPRYRSATWWPLLSAGFRPFFLLAGLWACLAMLLWLAMLGGLVDLPTAFAPVEWHFHEMLFGFVIAAIAGFLLTAIPNWTGRLPLQGWPLATLVGLWILGRVAVAFSAWIGAMIAAICDLAFLLVFTFVVAREIIAGRNWRNLPVLLALALLTVANALLHSGVFDLVEAEEIGKRLAISVITMLISLVGGRIIPSFTTNWLRRRGEDELPAPFDGADKFALTINGLALVVWTSMGLTVVSGISLILAAVVQAFRLARWRGEATGQEPLLWILHVGYGWLPLGLFLLGTSAWFPYLVTTAIHVLTVGAMGTMILAVMTRATLGHTKRPLVAGRGTLWIYILMPIATAARGLAPYLNVDYGAVLGFAGICWIAAYALFVFLYGPLCSRH